MTVTQRIPRWLSCAGEIAIVLGIVLALTAWIVHGLVGFDGNARSKAIRTANDLESACRLVLSYREKHGRLPEDPCAAATDLLGWQGGLARDGWGMPVRYATWSDAQGEHFALWSHGPDRESDAEDARRDDFVIADGLWFAPPPPEWRSVSRPAPARSSGHAP